MPYLNLIDEKESPCQQSRKIKKKGRGRRKLLADPAFLENQFDEFEIDKAEKRCSLKLFFKNEENHQLQPTFEF